MAITNLFIARHGETEYNRVNRMQGRGIDEPLNETGQLQSKAIAKFLEPYGLDIIFSSSLTRSRQTAELIAEKFDIDVVPYAELDEIGFGIFEGKYSHEIEDELNILHENWRNGKTHLAPENGESPKQALSRVRSRIIPLIDEYSGKNILFVLHGRLIRVLLSYWLGYGLERMHEIKHSNGGLNHLKWNGKAFEIICLNKTDHLQECFPKKVDSKG